MKVLMAQEDKTEKKGLPLIFPLQLRHFCFWVIILQWKPQEKWQQTAEKRERSL